jgi:hypothetical protein
LYAGRAYLDKTVIDPVRARVTELRERYDIADRRTVRLLPVAQPAPAEQMDLASAGFGVETAPVWRIAG